MNLANHYSSSWDILIVSLQNAVDSYDAAPSRTISRVVSTSLWSSGSCGANTGELRPRFIDRKYDVERLKLDDDRCNS